MNIYISRLDLQWKDKDLENLFTPFGDVASAAISMDGFTEKSRGFGFVEMPDDAQAQSAIAALNESTVDGHLLSVQQAEPKEFKRGSYKVGGGTINPYRFKKN
jgi:RNA recognition motif-containing protein